MWWSKRALGLHATVVVVVPVFIGLFWWQVQRVRQGNTLSWAYVFEWPFFTGYAVYLWWKLVHDQPAVGGTTSDAAGAGGAVGVAEGAGQPSAVGPRGGAGPTDAPEANSPEPSGGAPEPSDEDADDSNVDNDETQLAAYNRYLAELNASGRRKSW